MKNRNISLLWPFNYILYYKSSVCLFLERPSPPPPVGLRPPCSRGFYITHNGTPKSVGLLWASDQLVAQTSTWQHTALITDIHPCIRWDSNPQSQQAKGHRPTRQTARPLGPAKFGLDCTVIYIMLIIGQNGELLAENKIVSTDIYDMIYNTIWLLWCDIWYMIRYMIWCDVIWYMIRYMIRCDVIRCDIWYDMMWYMIRYDVIWYMIRYDMLWCDMMIYDTIRYMIWCDI